MSNLVNAFDFENPDYSIPDLPFTETPIADDDGNLIGLYNGFCAVEWTEACSSSEYVSGIPYGNQTEENSLVFEDGYKGVRGYLAEGHYLVFESNGFALSSAGTQLTATGAAAPYDSIDQRWYVKALTPEGTTFQLVSARGELYISQQSVLSTSQDAAEIYNVTYLGNSQYALQDSEGAYLNIDSSGAIAFDPTPISYKIWSVTYNN